MPWDQLHSRENGHNSNTCQSFMVTYLNNECKKKIYKSMMDALFIKCIRGGRIGSLHHFSDHHMSSHHIFYVLKCQDNFNCLRPLLQVHDESTQKWLSCCLTL